MHKPSKYINDVCHICTGNFTDLTLSKFTGEEMLIKMEDYPEESFMEYLYACCGCGEKYWVGEQWVKENTQTLRWSK